MGSVKEITIEITETKSNFSIKPHNGKKIDQLIVSQDMSYAVTYSEEDKSILGWLVEVEENRQQQPDVYFNKLDRHGIKLYKLYKLYKKMLLFSYYDHKYHLHRCLIDLSDGEGRILQLRHAEKISTRDKNSMEFLSNGDLILVDIFNHKKIYLYSFNNKPTNANATPWDYSQIYNIEFRFRESLNEIDYFVYQTKVFLSNEALMTQWDLLTMTFEMQYNLFGGYVFNMAINNNKTLLALHTGKYDVDKKIDVYSMETGMHISRYDSQNYIPVEFVILKDGSEGLLIFNSIDKKYKFLDPFHPSDAIDITNDIITDVITTITDDIITDDITDNITNDENINIVITKLNKKLYIKENNVWVADGLNEDTFKQMLDANYHSNIYNLSTFKTIQNMLINISNEGNAPEENKIIELKDGNLFHFILKKVNESEVEVKGIKKSRDNNEWKETRNTISFSSHDRILSYKQLNNQDLVLITIRGIRIYTIVDEGLLRLRYLWNNEKWNDYNVNNRKISIQEILSSEFNDSISSLPSPNFENLNEELILSTINDPVEFSKFGLKMLEIAIKKEKEGKGDVQLIVDKIIELFEKEDHSYMYMKLLPILSLKLPELYDNHYSSLVMKYILRTSILLDPSCSSFKYSTNTSLYAYSNDINIKKKSISSSDNYFKSLFLSFYKNHLKKQEEIPTISFIVPFPQICTKYQDKDYNPLNKILYQSKFVLFCNIDSGNFYKWWNFAAIIDFKWKTFGRFYYYLIWLLYTVFYLCFALAITLDLTDFYREILLILSILLGFLHLFFEVWQFWEDPGNYIFKDPWNLFDVGAYSLPIITSIYLLINNGGFSIEITAVSIILLNFKFLLFFRIFHSYGKYFAIMIGVAKEVFPFLVVLFLIIFGFGFAFFILLRSTNDYPSFNDDKNNPWNLATKYNYVNSDGTINSTTAFIQTPDSNTNMFSWFGTSLLAMYLLLTGDSGSLSSWTYREDPTMTFLLFVFTFTTVIYLMNLFIGLLNMAIDKYNKDEEFLLLKAQVISEIELFYMFPYQRRKKEWFPEWIYYDLPVEEVRKLINAIDENRTEFNSPPFAPFISKKLRKLIEVPEPDCEKDMKDELKQTKNELQQQQIENKLEQVNNEIKEMKELLNYFIKNSNINNDVKDKIDNKING